jgi:hypothetical protein
VEDEWDSIAICFRHYGLYALEEETSRCNADDADGMHP